MHSSAIPRTFLRIDQGLKSNSGHLPKPAVLSLLFVKTFASALSSRVSGFLVTSTRMSSFQARNGRNR